MRIYLTGFMGAGKTNLGRTLAARLEAPFIDLDEWIEQNERQSISQIFSEKGEAAFRRIEANWLRKTLRFSDAVIALGGGAPCFWENMDWINKHGVSIYLKKPVEVLVERLLKERKSRPLLADLTDKELENFVNSSLETRSPFYEQTHFTFHSTLENPAALDELTAFLMKFRDF